MNPNTDLFEVGWEFGAPDVLAKQGQELAAHELYEAEDQSVEMKSTVSQGWQVYQTYPGLSHD